MIARIEEPAAGPAPAFALFNLGFRPFYLLAALYAAIGVPLWALQFAGLTAGMNALWHAHEMLFGYAFAVIAGFLLTAVQAWTARPTAQGAWLLLLAALWVAARVTAFFSLAMAAALDLAFAAGLAWAIGAPLVQARNRRNLFFIALVLALGAASVLFVRYPGLALVAGLDVVLFIMAVMGGRVIPAFTNNAIPGAGARRERWVEYAALGAVLLLLVVDLFGWAMAAGATAGAAGLLHAARLALWAPLATRSRPILWILHLSYAWIVIHLALRALAGFDVVPAGLATHALTVGAIGGLTLGMMTRTARGHTGRPLAVGGVEVSAYVLVHAAALARVLLPLVFPGAYVALVVASGLLWSAAFALFVILYAPILTRSRLDGKPG